MSQGKQRTKKKEKRKKKLLKTYKGNAGTVKRFTCSIHKKEGHVPNVTPTIEKKTGKNSFGRKVYFSTSQASGGPRKKKTQGQHARHLPFTCSHSQLQYVRSALYQQRARAGVAVSTAPDLSGSGRVDMLTCPLAAA